MKKKEAVNKLALLYFERKEKYWKERKNEDPNADYYHGELWGIQDAVASLGILEEFQDKLLDLHKQPKNDLDSQNDDVFKSVRDK